MEYSDVTMKTLQHLLIYLPLLYSCLRKVYGQCSGSPQNVSVGYTAETITPPGYPTGYAANLNCKWLASTSISGDSILFRVTDMTINCAGDTLSVYDGTSSSGATIHPSQCTAGTTTTLGYQVATSGDVYSVMTSDASTQSWEKGFKMYMISGHDASGSGCSGSAQTLTATSSEQYLSSPNYPSKYPLSQSCIWTITTSNSNANVYITFKFLDIESSCNYDYLEINESATAIAKLCTENSFEPTNSYTSSGTSFTLGLTTDNYEDYKRGFFLSYKEIDSSSSNSSQNQDSNGLSEGNIAVIAIVSVVSGVGGTAVVVVLKKYPNRVKKTDDIERESHSSTIIKNKVSPDNNQNKTDVR